MKGRLSTTLFCAVVVAFGAFTVGCVDDGTTDDFSDLTSSRSFDEELLAEDMEALLPGRWAWDETSTIAHPTEGEALSIVFLGHDAVTGDVALLIESLDELQPARVVLEGGEATLWIGAEEASFRVERIEDDVLVLQGDESTDRLVYNRRR